MAQRLRLRRELFLADLATVDHTARQEPEEERQRLQKKLADTARKQDNVLRQAEDSDPRDPFTNGLRQRYNDLETERRTLPATLDALEKARQSRPQHPSIDSVDLIEALPHLKVNLHRAPAELLDRLFTLTQLPITVHYKTNEATLKPAGDGLCASCTCPRCGSYSIHTDSTAW